MARLSPRQYFKSMLSWWTGAWAVAVTGPLALGLHRLEPPWPEGSSVVAVVFSIVALAIARTLQVQLPTPTPGPALQRARWVVAASFVAALVMCMAYLYGYSMYVAGDVKSEGGRELAIRRVVGDDVLHAEDARTPPSTLLAENGFDEEQVWTRASLTRARLLVLCPYVGIFFCLCLGLGALANFERLGSSAASRRRPPGTGPAK